MFASRPTLIALAAAALTVGCAGRPQLIPNTDPNLRRTSTQFAADAVARHPYKEGAPRAGLAAGRAQVGYSMNVIEIENLSDEDWNDVEIWVNQGYVVYVPVMKKNKLERIPFQMLYDDKGNYFPIDNRRKLVDKVEVYMNDKMYDVKVQLAD